jgi:hypothetical protein
VGEGSSQDTLREVEQIRFRDHTVPVTSTTHSSYDALPSSLWHFFIVAFNGAPGVTYMNQLAQAHQSGASVLQIVEIFTGKSQFTDQYPVTLAPNEFAVRLVDNVVKNSAAADAKAKAITDIVTALGAGNSVGQVIYNIFGNLAAVPENHAVWGGTSRQFNKQILVADFYTDTMSQNTTDLATLR